MCSEFPEFPEFYGIVGKSKPMQKLFSLIEKVSSIDVDVLITGESGTGKDLVAKRIHELSARETGPFIPVNTGALSKDLIASELFGYEKGAFTGAVSSRKGKFEMAHGGTLFLDEISTTDEATQISLLRVLESKQFQRIGGEQFITADVRIIAATNMNLRKAVKNGTFRQDLYHRFNVLRIDLPPLRKRQEDIELLAKYYLEQYTREFNGTVTNFDPETLAYLKKYGWPGNVRELENLVLKLVVTGEGETIGPEMLPDLIRRAKRKKSRIVIEIGDTSIEEAERRIIEKTLFTVNGNKKKAASILGISRKALYNKLEQYEE